MKKIIVLLCCTLTILQWTFPETSRGGNFFVFNTINDSYIESLIEVSKPEEYDAIGLTENGKKLNKLIIPKEIHDINVYSDEYEFILESENLKELVIEEGIEYFEGSFEKCNNLEKIIIPDSVTDISLYECKNVSKLDLSKCDGSITILDFPNLTEIKFPSDGNYFMEIYLANCPKLRNISLPENNHTITIHINNCGLEKLDASSAASIEIKNCNKLSELKLPEKIDGSSLSIENCSVLKDIKLPGGQYLFEGKNCRNLSNIVIPTSFSSENFLSFENCFSIKSINLPDSIGVCSCKFTNCINLESIHNIKLNSAADYAFANCKKLKSVKLEEGADCIPWFAFFNCKNLKSINIPENVQRIKNHAFSGCENLEEITLPVKVTQIWTCAFENCYNLKKIIYKGTMEQWKKIELDRKWFIHYNWAKPLIIECSDGTIEISER